MKNLLAIFALMGMVYTAKADNPQTPEHAEENLKNFLETLAKNRQEAPPSCMEQQEALEANIQKLRQTNASETSELLIQKQTELANLKDSCTDSVKLINVANQPCDVRLPVLVHKQKTMRELNYAEDHPWLVTLTEEIHACQKP